MLRVRERAGASEPRADRAAQRASRRAARRASALRVPAGRSVRERLPPAQPDRPRCVLRGVHRDCPVDGAADCAELIPPAALAPARQGAHARHLERADDRRSCVSCNRDHVRRLRDHRLPFPPHVGGALHHPRRGGVPCPLVRPAARRGYSGSAASSTRSMTASSCGLSVASLGSPEILSAISSPDVTRPKTVCLPSSHGHASAVTMKNWLPFVFGPAFAIASAPRSTLCWLNSSSNW